MEDNNKNINVGTYVAGNIEEERMHPIFDECEVNDFGEVKRYYMLSMNGMYISGITDDQLKEMHGKLTELLTGEKPRKYFYAEASIPRKNGDILCKKDFVVETDGDKFPLVDALHHSHAFSRIPNMRRISISRTPTSAAASRSARRITRHSRSIARNKIFLVILLYKSL